MFEKPVYKRKIRFFTKDGTPVNVNEANVDFVLDDGHPKHIELRVKLPKFLDTELVQIDSQPTYLKMTINGKSPGDNYKGTLFDFYSFQIKHFN